MKQWLLIPAVVAMTLVAGCTKSETAGAALATPVVAAAPAPVDAVPVVTKLEQEWVAAILGKDTATIDRLLASDFRGTTDDMRYGKADAIQDVTTGTHEALDMKNVDVRVFGDTAVVTFDQDEKSHHGKDDFSGHYLFTNVWVQRNGVWHAVASHGSRLR